MVQRHATMIDIAKRAGVSQATVSMVLNDAAQGRVSPEKAQRIHEAAAELGYRTNTHARALREGNSRMIGFIGDEVATAPFAGELIRGAQAQAWARDHVLLSVETNADPRLEAAAIEMLLSYRVVGIIYATMYHRIVSLPKALREVPVVVANAEDASGAAPSIFPDEVRGGREAAECLLGAGHRRIAMINIAPEEMHLPAATGRLQGFREALADHRVEAREEWILHGTGDHSSGLELGRQLFSQDDRPTAVFCGNDRTALGCYQALAELGLRIPEDVSVVGFDDQDTLRECFLPALTTFQLPFDEMGRRAVRALVDGDADLADARHCPIATRGSTTQPKESR